MCEFQSLNIKRLCPRLMLLVQVYSSKNNNKNKTEARRGTQKGGGGLGERGSEGMGGPVMAMLLQRVGVRGRQLR